MIVFMALLNETGKGFLDIGMYEWSHFYVTVRSYIHTYLLCIGSLWTCLPVMTQRRKGM